MERCPVCRARFSGKPVCRRCKSDLSTLIQLEEQADLALQRAIHALAAQDIAKARHLCDYAAKINNSPFSTALAGFLASL